jgi:predicted ester cyclase
VGSADEEETTSIMSEENQAIVRRFFEELWNTGNPDAIDDFMDSSCDGDFFYLRDESLLPSAQEAFFQAKSPEYVEGTITARLEEMDKTHPEHAKIIFKGMIIKHEGKFRGIIKSSAKRYREAFPNVWCTIEEMVAEEDMVWTRWTLRGTHHVSGSGLGALSTEKTVTVTGVSISRVAGGKIQDYRYHVAFPGLGLEWVRGLFPRP